MQTVDATLRKAVDNYPFLTLSLLTALLGAELSLQIGCEFRLDLCLSLRVLIAVRATGGDKFFDILVRTTTPAFLATLPNWV